MKIFLTFTLFLCINNLFAQESINSFFEKNSAAAAPKFRFNKYESVISGTASLIIGNMGYYISNSKKLKLSYSFIQTIGIITISQGVKTYYDPNIDQGIYDSVTNNNSKQDTLESIVYLLAQRDRAQRLGILSGTGLLSIQYLLNALTTDSIASLKETYLFLSAVNGIIATYSFFYRSHYEKYEEDKLKIIPVATMNNDNLIAGVQLSLTFP
jgi:hypothetical protein